MDDLEEQLVSELWARDVQFLRGRTSLPAAITISDASLIASLAESSDPRVCFSLIPLFLRHPEYSEYVLEAKKLLSSQAGIIALKFYYTAAVFLQKKHIERIQNVIGEYKNLQDYFSQDLSFTPDKEPDRALIQLAEQHRLITGQFVNWLGTYEHAADIWLRQMELQKA